jgi:hypothetical protein
MTIMANRVRRRVSKFMRRYISELCRERKGKNGQKEDQKF